MSQDNAQITVLVCDDTGAKRYVISTWLRRDGYRVLEAQTGAEALDIAARGVDLAILDVQLPDMSGLEVCAAIRSDPMIAATPVVHVTAVAVEPTDRSEGLDNGADAYLVAPIDPRDLLSTVHALLRSSGARREAEQLAERLDRLSAAGLRVNVALTAPRLCAAAAEGAARMLTCESVAVLVNEEQTATAYGRGADGLGLHWDLGVEEARRLLDLGPGPALVYAADDPWSTVLRGAHEGPWLVTPISRADAVVGLIAVPAHAAAGGDDRMLLGRLTQAVAVALENLRVFGEEHRVALMLQRSLLPASLPELPGLHLAARYKASGEQAEVGGDFFDAFRTEDGRSVVVIGDVQGHSLEAAVVMAEVRYSLRAYVHEGYGPDRVLARLNAMLLRSHPDLTATVCVLEIAADVRTVRVANAGHIPPLIIRHGRPAFLDYGSPLLGVDSVQEAPTVVDLTPGTRLVLVTDGVVERRGDDISASMDRFADDVVTSGSDASPDGLCDALMRGWGANVEDDVCLIVLDVVGHAARRSPEADDTLGHDASEDERDAGTHGQRSERYGSAHALMIRAARTA